MVACSVAARVPPSGSAHVRAARERAPRCAALPPVHARAARSARRAARVRTARAARRARGVCARVRSWRLGPRALLDARVGGGSRGGWTPVTKSELAHGVRQFTRRRCAIMTGEELLTPLATLYQVEVCRLVAKTQGRQASGGHCEDWIGLCFCGALWGSGWSNRAPRDPLFGQTIVGLCAGAPLFLWHLLPHPRQASRPAAENLFRRGRLPDTPDWASPNFLGAARIVESCKWGSRWSNSSINLYTLLDQGPAPPGPAASGPPWRSLGGRGGRPPAPQARAGPVPVQRRLLNRSETRLSWGTLTVSWPRIAKPRIG